MAEAFHWYLYTPAFTVHSQVHLRRTKAGISSPFPWLVSWEKWDTYVYVFSRPLIALCCHGFCLGLLGKAGREGKELPLRDHCAFMMSEHGGNMKTSLPVLRCVAIVADSTKQILGWVVYQLLILCLIKHTALDN